MPRRVPLPFEQQQSYNSALFFERLNRTQLIGLFIDVLGFDGRRAAMVPMIVAQLGVSAQPMDTGRVVVLINPESGYDVALDVLFYENEEEH